jgi:azurin
VEKNRLFKFTFFDLLASISIIIAVVAYSVFHHPSSADRQAAGQMGSQVRNETFQKGGTLQRSLSGGEKVKEFINETVNKNSLGYLKKEFTVHAGSFIRVTLQNRSTKKQEADWVLVRPGTRQDVQALASDTAKNWEWIPDSSDILAFVPMTQPGNFKVGVFRAPSEPGDYPFLCTFPGQGEVMNGVLHVV